MKKCPLIHEPCCKDECQFYDEKNNNCNFLLPKQEEYKNIKKQNTILKVVSLTLSCIIIMGVVLGLIMNKKEDNEPASTLGYIKTSEGAVALVDNYFEN